jgi:hypothetical protein
MKHLNNKKCPACAEIFDKFPNFNQQLRGWFISLQAKYPESHISCAGRGVIDQESKVNGGRSRAHYGFSAHNYNCAIDLFVQLPGKDIYDSAWFKNVLAPEIPYFLEWYGAHGSSYYELPHVQIREWRGLKVTGAASLVEPIPDAKIV